MSSFKVLVTGANGFLGNHVVRELLNRNYRVLAFVRPGSKIGILDSLNCEIIRGELGESKDLNAALRGCKYVIHCASLTTPYIDKFEPYKKVNVTYSQILVEACKKAGIERFIYVSSANSFTGGSLNNLGNEETKFKDRFKSSGYAYSKYLAQKYLLEEVKNTGFPAIVVAPSFLIGPFDPKPSSGLLIRYIMKNKIIFYPPGGKSFVDVTAVAVAVVNALNLGCKGECYLLTGVNLTYKNFYKIVSKHCQQTKILIPVPNFIINVVAAIYFVFPLNKLKLLRTNLYLVFLDNYFDNKKAMEQLNMPETNITLSVAETVTWFRETSI